MEDLQIGDLKPLVAEPVGLKKCGCVGAGGLWLRSSNWQHSELDLKPRPATQAQLTSTQLCVERLRNERPVRESTVCERFLPQWLCLSGVLPRLLSY